MAVRLSAPYGAREADIYLPNPEWDDSKGHNVTVKVDRAIDGTPYTTKITTDQLVFELSFEFSKEKYFETYEFLKLYETEWMEFTNYDGTVWRVILITQLPEWRPMSKEEWTTISLSFKGEQV